ncbi:MAG: hypothetical protein ACPIOQ_08595 [Promethearchaeia archaeon]
MQEDREAAEHTAKQALKDTALTDKAAVTATEAGPTSWPIRDNLMPLRKGNLLAHKGPRRPKSAMATRRQQVMEAAVVPQGPAVEWRGVRPATSLGFEVKTRRDGVAGRAVRFWDAGGAQVGVLGRQFLTATGCRRTAKHTGKAFISQDLVCFLLSCSIESCVSAYRPRCRSRCCTQLIQRCEAERTRRQ